MHTYTLVPQAQVWKSGDNLQESVNSPCLLCGFGRLNSGCQTWALAHFLTQSRTPHPGIGHTHF